MRHLRHNIFAQLDRRILTEEHNSLLIQSLFGKKGWLWKEKKNIGQP